MEQPSAGAPAAADLGAAELVMAVARRMRQLRSTALEPYGLSPHQGRAFLVVARCTAAPAGSVEPELRLSGLAERLRITPRSTTEVVDALQDKGLLQRSPSLTDRRATALTLTPHGRRLLNDMHAVGQSADLFAVLTDDQRTTLIGLLRLVADADPETD